MKTRSFSISAALILVGSLAVTSAFTQDAPKAETPKAEAPKTEAPTAEAPKAAPKPQSTSSAKSMIDKPARKVTKVDKDGKQMSPYSLAERTAMAKIDCAPGTGTHGVYRGYTQWDPELKTTAGKELFAACIKRGLEPAPWFAVHRMAYGMGAKSAFGKTKEDCLKCHEKGY